ncbi:MAG: PKD domain-containing protein [Candidatus Gracilibacteria bacterium]|nr:PKD domain-containing protein [Candidatus Gracilibacteria bacterium]
MKIKVLVFLLLSLFFKSTSAENVENVFHDINKDYIYYNELQSLYDKGMIFPDSDAKFNANSLIKRDDFVGITMEVNCMKCIQPNTPLDLITKYSGLTPFFDVVQTNKNFYCISEGKENGFAVGYDKSYKCDNGTTKTGDEPFCINNNITKEEALAIMLRKSSIFTLADSDQIIKDIYNGTISENLANDVPAKINGNPYTFYGYFKKALEYKLVEYDTAGNKHEYKLIEKDSNGNLNPKKAITKQEFLNWAYILLKANSCNISANQTKLNIGVDLNILDKSCNKTISSCPKSDLKNSSETTYDLKAIVGGVDLSKLTDNSYVRQLYNTDTGESAMIYGVYIDNYKFNNGHRNINLTVVDSDGNIGKAKGTLYVNNNNNNGFSIDMTANPVYGNAYLGVNFTSTNSDTIGNYTYSWNFGDGQTGEGMNIDHIYQNPGVYEAVLIVTNTQTGEKEEARVTIKVDNFIKCSNSCSCDKGSVCTTKDPKVCAVSGICIKDTDLDGLADNVDKCPVVYGPIINQGCPILSNSCSSNCACPKGSTCSSKDGSVCSKIGICAPDNRCNSDCSCDKGSVCSTKDPNICSKEGICVPENSCLYPSSGSSIFGNMICRTCPCDLNFDFLASVRKCDTIFPAIISPDKQTIYSKGNNYLIK